MSFLASSDTVFATMTGKQLPTSGFVSKPLRSQLVVEVVSYTTWDGICCSVLLNVHLSLLLLDLQL